MGRTPCCEKMGLKKGPCTPQEDQILISYIQRNDHANWRALPKQAGLLRCGKSCRLRWINYLRPDIKRGNFTKEEEETIFKLHEMLGNKWSAIAAKLPGRTDNEIKNVWHTHLKKKLLQETSQFHNSDAKRGSKPRIKRSRSNSSTITHSESSSLKFSEKDSTNNSACTSSGDFSSKNMDPSVMIKSEEEYTESLEAIVSEIDESFWSHSLRVSNELPVHQIPFDSTESCGNYSLSFDDGMDFWFDLFIRSGDSTELPEF